ncbi:DAZ-associated protein 2 isoform X1 [Numida meleagris]|uniref:DAZ-associated protein 2 isoform X1 n=1 Tax=Numida meleagris TaxID=8996 RepID=UPI000B3E296C|nr:DAZ-associated protein 2 isoform X1 [Numida meleagris]
MNGKGQYPTQPSYPVQSAANPPVYPQTVPLPQPPPYTDAPPAYSEDFLLLRPVPMICPARIEVNSERFFFGAKVAQSPQLYRPSFVPLGAATVPTMSAAYPGASVFLPVAQSVAVGPIASSVPMAYYPVGPVYPPGSTVLVEGGFDAGARFGAGGTASIPPPPPGCPPNAAQLAVMQGANVLVTQRKGNFFLGGSDGGYTI